MRPAGKWRTLWNRHYPCAYQDSKGQAECERDRRGNIYMGHRFPPGWAVLLSCWIEPGNQEQTGDVQPQTLSKERGQPPQLVFWGRKTITDTTARFELADWKQATVQFNYHISVDRMLYSVPYEYIKKKVYVRVTEHTIEIFYNHNRIAPHRRPRGRSGQYSTITEHMPQDHQRYLEWNGDRFRKWTERIGINTYTVVIRVNGITLEISNDISESLLCMLLKEVAHAWGCTRNPAGRAGTPL